MNKLQKLLYVYKMRRGTKKVDDARDRKIGEIEGVTSIKNIRYASYKGKWGLLDVHTPENASSFLPTIVVVHGGGWCYGTKETYYLYGRYLAKQGFGVVVYSYPLAPEHPYPTQLLALDEALIWLKDKGKDYHLNAEKVLLFGDSAGGHLALHYTEITLDKGLREAISPHFRCPISIRALGLNCATFAHLGKHEAISELLGLKDKEDQELDPKNYLSKKLPPMYLITGDNDFLKEENIAMDALLKEKGIPHGFKLYIGKDKPLDHVFPCNMILEEAREATKDEIEYLMSALQG